jgi:hypothetical protein
MKKIVYCICIAFFGVIMNFSVSGQSNRANEFDYIGSSHNSVIESFFSEYSPERVRSENLKIDGLNDYILGKLGIKETEFVKGLFKQPHYRACLESELSDLPTLLKQANFITDNCGRYLNLIRTAIDSDLESGSVSFYNSIKNIEDEFNNDKALNENERGLLLSTASTARYSAGFWIDNLESIQSKFGSLLLKGNENLQKLPRWLRELIAADVSGAAGGWVVGALVGGTVTLGTLTVPAGAAGALTGGVGNSVTSGVSSLWNWIFN